MAWWFKETPIRWVIGLVIVLSLSFLMVTLILGLRSVQTVTRSGEDLFNQNQLTLAQKIADEIRESVLELANGLLEMTQILRGHELQTGENQALSALFTHLRVHGVIEFQAVDPQGRVLFQLGLSETPEPRVRDVLRWAGEQKNTKGIFITPPFRLPGQTDPNLYMILAAAFFHHDGSHGGACFVRTAANMIALRATVNVVSGRTGYAWILDPSGVFLAHHDFTFVGRNSLEVRREKNPQVSYQGIDRLTRERLLKGETGTAVYESGWHRHKTGRIKKLIAFTPVRFIAQPDATLAQPVYAPVFWSVAVVAPVTEVSGLLESVSRQQWRLAGLLTLVIIFSAVGAIFFTLHWSSLLQKEVQRKTTDLEIAQKKLIHAERLTAVGQGVVHVSHEIKNPLMLIGGFARQVARKIQGDENSVQKLNLIAEEVQRLEKLLNEVRDFTRVREPQKQEERINTIVQKVADLMEPALTSSGVQLQLNLDSASGFCRIDPDQIKQVLINLVKNAIEAMSQGGTISLRTRGSANHVQVEVEDTGRGIGPEHLTEIFNPFFTTKEKGTGLGLAVSLKIINDHNGDLLVSSQLDQGTLFTVKLPR
jgi:two-component system, NtrC family, sensor histidine kinase HydH